MTGYRELSRNRDFTILWTGQTVSDLGSNVSMFVFPLVAYALSGSALWAAVVEAAFLLGMCGALLPAGVLADRVHRRLLMRTASGAGVVFYTSLGVAGALGILTVPHLTVVALLTGVASGLAAPAEISSIRSVVRPEDLSTALSQSQARQHIASLLGGPLGGILYAVARWLPTVSGPTTCAPLTERSKAARACASSCARPCTPAPTTPPSTRRFLRRSACSPSRAASRCARPRPGRRCG